jgi:phosphoglycerate dehydrogenase-like enzyme
VCQAVPRLKVLAYTHGDLVLDDIARQLPEIDFRHCVLPEEAREALPAAEVLFLARLITPDEAQLISKNLRWLHSMGAGIDHLLPVLPADLDPIISNARGVASVLIAEYVLCVALMLRWQMPRLVKAQTDHRWERWATGTLSGQKLGLVGLGSIGKEIARRGRALEMTVFGTRRGAGVVEEVDRLYPLADLREMAAAVDVLVVTVPITPATANLIDRQVINAMRPTSTVIVVGRGRVIDEEALADALRAGRLAGAALDVFAQEPLTAASPLWNVPNLLITPHMSGEIVGRNERNIEFFKDNLRRFLDGEPLRSVVDRKAGY